MASWCPLGRNRDWPMAVDLPPVGEVGLHDLGGFRKQSAQHDEVRIVARRRGCGRERQPARVRSLPTGSPTRRSRPVRVSRRVLRRARENRPSTGLRRASPSVRTLMERGEFLMIAAVFEIDEAKPSSGDRRTPPTPRTPGRLRMSPKTTSCRSSPARDEAQTAFRVFSEWYRICPSISSATKPSAILRR